MQASYQLDSDSDEDVEEGVVAQETEKPTTWHLQDIEKLKEQTTELLDSTWKDSRNKHLLSKMLELEQPSITVKMVDFLLQDGVCESLMGFITQTDSTFPRPAPNDPHTPELKKAYRAVLLLSPESPSDALNAFLSKKAAIIARCIFDVFRTDSAGSFYHAYRILECLLRCYPSDVFEGLYSDGLLGQRLVDMLRYTGYAPVCEMLVMVVALTPVPRNNALFMLCAQSRLGFLEELGNLDLMLQICRVIGDPMSHCDCSSYVNEGQHSSAATQLFLELVEKLSLEEPGELLLQHIGKFPTIVDMLINTSIQPTAEETDQYRRCAARVVCFLLRRAADAEILCYTVQPNGAPPTTTCVPNRLFALRENIVGHTRFRLNDIMSFLLNFDTFNHGTKDPIKYGAYEISKPFTALRSLVMEVLVLLVESEETVAGVLNVDLWKLMIVWAIKYAFNNIYHALFYRIIFAVLRQGQEQAQRILFQKAKFASFLVENFVPFEINPDTGLETPTISSKYVPAAAGSDPNGSNSSEVSQKNIPNNSSNSNSNSNSVVSSSNNNSKNNNSGSSRDDLTSRRIAARGLIMNCANAIRLQVSTQPPQSFLNNFLNAHPKWKEFIPLLMVATEVQLRFAMGVDVSNTTGRGSPEVGLGNAGSLGMLLGDSPPPSIGHESSPEQASRFAKSLGFLEEAEWSLHAHPHPGYGNAERNSIDPSDSHLVRRHSFEEGYGVFAHDYMEETEMPLVDEIDMAMHSHSPNSSFAARLSSSGSSPSGNTAAAVAAALLAGEAGSNSDSTSGRKDRADSGGVGAGGDDAAAEFIDSLPPPPPSSSQQPDDQRIDHSGSSDSSSTS